MIRCLSISLTACCLTASIWACDSFLLLAPDQDPEDNFGWSVALAGDVSVVGAFEFGGFGSAYVFREQGSAWSYEATLSASDGELQDFFGFSVAAADDVVVVGAYRHDDVGCIVGQDDCDSGAAYVYRYDGTSWSEEAKLTASDGQLGDWFGRAVAIDGDAILVGAARHGGAAGAAYVYRFDGVSWVEEAKLTANDAEPNDQLGFSVDLAGDLAALGSPGEDAACGGGANCDSGAVYVFHRTGLLWSQEAKLVAGDAIAGDGLGLSVAVGADLLVAGKQGTELLGGSEPGAAYVFRESQGAWAEEQKLTATVPVPLDWFGYAVDLNGDHIAVGARGTGTRGSVHLFRESTMGWEETLRIQGSQTTVDGFGNDVALNAEHLVVGANLEDGGATNAGVAYLYDVAGFVRGDANQDGSTNLSDVVFLLGALFVPGAPFPSCADAADADDDGALNLGDVVYQLSWLFAPSAPPLNTPTGPCCGPDPSADPLDCARFDCP